MDEMTTSPSIDPIARLKRLADPDLGLSALTALVEEIERETPPELKVKLGLSASSAIDLLGLYLRRQALLSGVHLTIYPGNFDDPLGDIDRFSALGVRQIVLAPFFDALAPGFEVQASAWAPELMDGRLTQFREHLSLTLDAASQFDTVYLSDFHRLYSPAPGIDPVDPIMAEFNAILHNSVGSRSNVQLIQMDTLIADIGRGSAFDHRFYHRYSAPYSSTFLARWAQEISDISRGFGSHFFKALVLDCDNTLWGGILGEDGPSDIHLDANTYPGNVFWRVQHVFRQLRQRGVLICLCSKNNAEDIRALFAKQNSMVLRETDIVLSKVNWDDKVENIAQIAKELDIGLSSIVFIDDSSFECEAVKARLPMVKVFQVPKNLSEYVPLAHKIGRLFPFRDTDHTGVDKTNQYRIRQRALDHRTGFESHEAYLESLQLVVSLQRDYTSKIARIAELSQKSNQFNLTTRRYSVAEITALCSDPNATVYSLSVADRFGDSGTTGVIIVRRAREICEIEAMFMSCRVLGRGVEFSPWPILFGDQIKLGCKILKATYSPTEQNVQCRDYYDRLGLGLANNTEERRDYEADLSRCETLPTPWIRIENAG
jgi:FkbH-like protein